MTPTSTACKECQWGYKISAVVFVCTLFLWAAYHVFDLGTVGITTQWIIGSLFVIISAWTVWVVKTLYNMVFWWTDILQRVDTAQTLLEQTHQDLKEIKSIQHELPGR